MDPISGIPLGPDYSAPVADVAPVIPAAPPGTPLPVSDTVWLVNGQGQQVKAKMNDVPVLLGQGYVQMDPNLARKLDLQEKHDSAVESLKAFGQGAFETLAPVVAPLVMAGAGRSMEAQRESAEMHPIAHPVGQVVGAVAPAIATMGASAPAATAAGVTGMAARASAPEMINLAGQTVGRAVEGIAGKSALSRITASAVNQATQGAAYAGADWANRAVQGDPRATAEQLFSQGAGAVIFGGGLGALGGAMTRVASGAIPDVVGTLRDLEARGGLKATGAIQAELTKWLKQIPKERLEEIGRILGREGGVGPFKSFDEMLQLAEDRFKAPAFKRMEAVLDSVTGEKKGYGFVDEIFDAVRRDPMIRDWGKHNLSSYRAAHDKFMAELDDIQRRYTVFDANGNVKYYKSISPTELHKLSKDFSNAARNSGRTTMMDPMATETTAAYDKARYLTNQRIEQMFEDVERAKNKIPGKLAAEWKDAKLHYQTGLFLEDGANRGLRRSMGNNQVSPMETIGAMTGALAGHAPGAALLGATVAVVRREGAAIENLGARRLADFLEKMQQRSGQKITDGIGKIFRAGTGRLSAEFADSWAEHRITREDYPDTIRRLNRLAQDPEHTAQQVTNSFGPLVEGNGQVALALHDTASKVAANLSASLPTPQKAGPLDPDYTPSRSELAVLNRQWVIAHDPTSILHRIADGTYLEEDGKGLQAMYPALAPKIKAAVADALAEKLASGEIVPAKARLGLSQFLGMELDSRATGLTIAAAQAAYAQQEQAQQNQKPAPKVNFESSSKQYATDRQTSQDRMGKA